MVKRNLVKLADFYKYTHYKQYPKDTRTIYSYLEARKIESPVDGYSGGLEQFTKHGTLFYGLQMFIKEFLLTPITQQDIDEAEIFSNNAFGTQYFNRKGWQHILEKHNGYLPVRIKAVPEGTVVPLKNVLVTIENTDEEVPFITNFVETLLMNACWYPITVGTISYNIKQTIKEFAEKTGCQVSPFHLNDFGFRGASSVESAGIGGSAHLINFMGTDTSIAIDYAMHYYNAPHCGFSVAATEHSTTTSHGKENELKAYEQFLDSYPSGILSIVIDSYDTMKAVEMLGTVLKDKVLARDGKTVFRPDSGDPVLMSLEVVKALDKYFGSTVNEKGFKTINPKIGVIYGDGIDNFTIYKILKCLYENKYSTDNIVFGMGGALLQKVNRDTFGFAIKCSAINRDGVWHDVFKESNSGFKKSKAGRMKLIKGESGELYTVREENASEDILQTVFENGKLIKEYTFDEIKERAGR